MHVASVVPVSANDRTYSVAIPESLIDRITPGQRVRIPIGRRDRIIEAFVLDISTGEWNSTLKFIDSLVDERSWLSPHLLELGRWLAGYYAAPLGKALSIMVPAVVRRQSGYRRVRYIWRDQPVSQIAETAARIGPKQRLLLESLPDGGEAVLADLIGSRIQVSMATLREAVKRGWVKERFEKWLNEALVNGLDQWKRQL